MSYGVVLFDLDGTITMSEEGIFNSIEYASLKYGFDKPDRAKLRCFIGPPLQKEFQRFYGLNDEQGALITAYYREYYSVKGVFECVLYDGVEDMLKTLYSSGKRLALATSKPEKFARAILEHFGLDKYFEVICGSDMSPESSVKSVVINNALKRLSLQDTTGVIMVGDRHHDIDGAKQCHLASMGVLYGYGDRAEHENAGADYIAPTAKDVVKIVCG